MKPLSVKAEASGGASSDIWAPDSEVPAPGFSLHWFRDTGSLHRKKTEEALKGNEPRAWQQNQGLYLVSCEVAPGG